MQIPYMLSQTGECGILCLCWMLMPFESVLNAGLGDMKNIRDIQDRLCCMYSVSSLCSAKYQ